jgi:hypothetical protein
MDDKTIEGGILSSPLRKAGPGQLRESLGTILDPAFMTAMISGPRYRSTIELQREADARFCARRQYTQPVRLFRIWKKIYAHLKQRHAKFQIMCFRSGNNV